MKKIELYNIIKTNKFSDDVIIRNMNQFMELNGFDSELFCKTCINNNINDEIFEELLNIYLLCQYFYKDSSKIEVYEKLNLILNNDYIVSYVEFNNILKTISMIICSSIDDLLLDELWDEDDYILSILDQYIGIFEKAKKYDYSAFYEHDYTDLSEKFIYLVGTISNTEQNENTNFISDCITRIELFSDLVVDPVIFNLNEEKYSSVTSVAISINDITDLKRFISSVKRISPELSNEEYKIIVDSYSENISLNTINLINELSKTDKNILKKVLKKESKKEVFNKVLDKKLPNNIIKL